MLLKYLKLSLGMETTILLRNVQKIESYMFQKLVSKTIKMLTIGKTLPRFFQ